MKSHLLGCAVVLTAVVAIAEPALAADPFVGTWVLDVAKSSFSPGPAPAAVTLTTRDIGNGKFNTTLDATEQNGKVEHFEITYANDGADYPVAGPVPDQTVSCKYISTQTLEITLKIGGNPISTTIDVVAADLSTRTSTTTIGTTQRGTPIRKVQVLERE